MREWPFIGKHLSPAKELEGLLVFAQSKKVDQMGDKFVFMLFSVHELDSAQLLLSQQSLIIFPYPIFHPRFVSDFHEKLRERIFGKQLSDYSEK